MSKSFEFINAIVLKDDELLVVNGGQNEVNCGAGCGVGCGGGCGEDCMGCQKNVYMWLRTFQIVKHPILAVLYRLPQKEGTERIFRRTESVIAADKHNKLFWPTMKVVYHTDKITISNFAAV